MKTILNHCTFFSLLDKHFLPFDGMPSNIARIDFIIIRVGILAKCMIEGPMKVVSLLLGTWYPYDVHGIMYMGLKVIVAVFYN